MKMKIIVDEERAYKYKYDKKSKPIKRKRLIRELINQVQEKTVQTVSKETRNQITNAVLFSLSPSSVFQYYDSL